MKRPTNPTGGMLEHVRLRSITARIIVFAVVATLVPSFTMGWLSYRNNVRALEEKIEVGLGGALAQATRELQLWLESRRQDTRVLAGSYEVSENVEKLRRGPSAAAGERLADYLARVGGRFEDYESLVVLDLDGTMLAASRELDAPPPLPDGWRDALPDGRSVLGTPDSSVTTLVEPIRSARGTIVGAMVARVELRSLDRLLAGADSEGSHTLCVTDAEGEVLAASAGLVRGGGVAAAFSPRAASAVLGAPGRVADYRSFTGVEAIGMARRMDAPGWFVVAERERGPAYAALHRLRERTLQLTAIVALVVGLLGWLLAVTLVRPLNRLVAAARRVARGDFDVQLPVRGGGEVAYLTSVFNSMTASLRASYVASTAAQEALRERNTELLEEALTDPLTGLFNRKSFQRILDREVAAARRHDRPVSILMLDVDRFKPFNARYGHLAGDAALRAIADCIRSTARGCDYAMRYGGEEFLVLTENDAEGAERLGERLREQVAALELDDGGRITISVGVATFGLHAHDEEELIAQADAALYVSKNAGRDRVTLAEERAMPPAPEPVEAPV